MGMFIKVKVNKEYEVYKECACCISICPVDIFSRQGNKIVVVEKNEDECTLCGLCIEACPEGAISIKKLYEE